MCRQHYKLIFQRIAHTLEFLHVLRSRFFKNKQTNKKYHGIFLFNGIELHVGDLDKQTHNGLETLLFDETRLLIYTHNISNSQSHSHRQTHTVRHSQTE